MRIKNNISALNSSRNHGIVQEQLGKSLESCLPVTGLTVQGMMPRDWLFQRRCAIR